MYRCISPKLNIVWQYACFLVSLLVATFCVSTYIYIYLYMHMHALRPYSIYPKLALVLSVFLRLSFTTQRLVFIVFPLQGQQISNKRTKSNCSTTAHTKNKGFHPLFMYLFGAACDWETLTTTTNHARREAVWIYRKSFDFMRPSSEFRRQTPQTRTALPLASTSAATIALLLFDRLETTEGVFAAATARANDCSSQAVQQA